MNQGPSKAPEPNPFLDLMHDVGPYALRFATYLTGQPTVAEDIVQEAWAHRDRLSRMGNPRAWFLAIVRRECIDHWRRQKRQPTMVDIDGRQPVSAGPPDPFDGIDNRIDMADLLATCRHAIRRFWRGDTGWTGHSIPSLNTPDYRCQP